MLAYLGNAAMSSCHLRLSRRQPGYTKTTARKCTAAVCSEVRAHVEVAPCRSRRGVRLVVHRSWRWQANRSQKEHRGANAKQIFRMPHRPLAPRAPGAHVWANKHIPLPGSSVPEKIKVSSSQRRWQRRCWLQDYVRRGHITCMVSVHTN